MVICPGATPPGDQIIIREAETAWIGTPVLPEIGHIKRCSVGVILCHNGLLAAGQNESDKNVFGCDLNGGHCGTPPPF